jgi:anti-anti-sigma factor
MDSLQIEILLHPARPDTVILRLRGALGAGSLAVLDRSLQSSLDESKKNLVLDLAEVESVSGSGWGLMLTFARKLRVLDGDLLLASLGPEVRDAFDLLEYGKVMASYPDLETALHQGLGPSRTSSAPFPPPLSTGNPGDSETRSLG